MHRVRMLQHHKITPYLVFDGGPLPAKRGTESDRAAHRAQNLARGQALAARGQKAAARDCFCKCVDITPQMAFQLIKVRHVSLRFLCYTNFSVGIEGGRNSVCGGTLRS